MREAGFANASPPGALKVVRYFLGPAQLLTLVAWQALCASAVDAENDNAGQHFKEFVASLKLNVDSWSGQLPCRLVFFIDSIDDVRQRFDFVHRTDTLSGRPDIFPRLDLGLGSR